MTAALIFIAGASSGIGLALAATVPYPGARIIGISRRPSGAAEHLPADLADPASWPRVAEFFEKEIAGFGGERVVFIHSAGTLDPMGFAGEVDGAAYARNVILNSAAPQVLGDSFLRAMKNTKASGHMVMISSGASHSVYQGWTSYGAGKAAVDQWVRTAGAEQASRGDHCRILSVAPGVVATDMQRLIRDTPAEAFPDVERFVELHETGGLRDPAEVAAEIWALVDQKLENGTVIDLRDPAPE